ncbi:MAG: HEAT repeat domain-containing protein [Gammaproteobacteria bacterium]|nr:hypothetical protein [Gammaproteobacteria bacterium]NIO62262.1 hypothetical protein [Gammaproteobacteria bacterium]NIP48781.1 HEAT repeat domain-containing protein [Gammaproteobacteria bacterium]NIQ09235.1 HEAT repeat domain-containing protein [Gammaproteobacteria bacterium]NIQ19934.1 hypothetical protein [Gammaproteobacteria bacterium]
MIRFHHIVLLGSVLLLASCSDANSPETKEQVQSAQQANLSSPINSDMRFQQLYRKVVTGEATLAEIRELLTDTNVAGLTNTLHGLYTMRYHRGVIHLLDSLWQQNKTLYPELSWELLAKTPSRIALASTLNRIYIGQTREYINFIREHKDEEHEFHLAQVAIALGLNGDPADVDYLEQLASGDNVYIVQTSMSALALMNNPKARDALIDIEKEFSDDPRSKLATELLWQAYRWPDQKAG